MALRSLIALLPLLLLPLQGRGQTRCTVSHLDGLTIIRLPADARLSFTDRLPPQAEALLCIPAAFTTTEGTIQGAYVINGRQQGRATRHTRVSLSGDTFTLGQQFTTDNGFQQMCLVRAGQPVHFRDESAYVRRALCKEDDHSPAIIIESERPLTMNQFARKLARHVRHAVYTDMGSFGFGWYYASSAPTYLSPLYFYKQRKQTNWLVCYR